MTLTSARKWTLDTEIEATKVAIKAAPGDSALRAAYFQLLCVKGDWKRAGDQLQLVESLDFASAMFAQAYSRALQCEHARHEVLNGSASPTIFGEPSEWIAAMVEALRHGRTGNWDAASKVQSNAFEAAPASAGTINGVAVEWMIDADSRLGPILEAFIEGQYRWVPFSRISRLSIMPPEHLVDTIWVRAQFFWTNGGMVKGLIPARYSNVENSSDERAMRATVTEWTERTAGFFTGIGQRLIATDREDYGILDIREIVFREKDGE